MGSGTQKGLELAGVLQRGGAAFDERPRDRDVYAGMMAALVGRDAELSILLELLGRVGSDRPGIVFVTGEAGAGKTRLIDEALGVRARPVLRGEARLDSPTPYAPLVDALRGYYGDRRDALAARPLAGYLSVLLPELGFEPIESDQPTLNAAIVDALAPAAEERGLLVLEDLHWADAGTLDVLLDLSKLPARSGLSIVATYRNDELPRLHRLRRVRSELRRVRRLTEIALEPLSREDTYALAKEVAGTTLPAEIVRSVYERSEGIPFFVEELAALAVELPVATDRGASEAALPETIRDAMRQRTESLDDEARHALDVMAVAGPSIPLPLFAELVDPDSISRLLEHGWLVRSGDGIVWFRHALVRDAVYSDIPWLRRRDLHRSLAEALETQGSAPERAAHHWLAAHEPTRARPHLLMAARAFCALHAYRDAQQLLREAVAGWPEIEQDHEGIAALELLAECIELSGDHVEAATMWRQLATLHLALGAAENSALAQRRLATALEMQGDWSGAVDARVSAAIAFEESGRSTEAMIDRAAAAAHMQAAGDLSAALELVEAPSPSTRSESPELTLRIRALEGQIRAKLGESHGMEIAKEALGTALTSGYTTVAADAYYRLASALEHTAKYEGALDAYEAAAEFCKGRGLEAQGDFCFACLAPVLRHMGQWKEAATVCRSVLSDAGSPVVASHVAAGELGLIHALKGNGSAARRLLRPTLRFARANDIFGLVVETSWGEAIVGSLTGKDEAATTIATELIEDCGRREERHYSISAMRWCVTWFALRGDPRMLSSAARILSDSAAATGAHEANAALSYASVESALIEGDAGAALAHARQTLALLDRHPAPFDSAEIRTRCAVALALGGERNAALDALTTAYRTARKLGARPLARAIVEHFDELGEPVEPHLGRTARAGAERGGLSRRELDVLRHVAAGRTNKEIAELLFLSTRTVDMHVRNVFTKLDCRSRTEAVARASELQLLGAK